MNGLPEFLQSRDLLAIHTADDIARLQRNFAGRAGRASHDDDAVRIPQSGRGGGDSGIDLHADNAQFGNQAICGIRLCGDRVEFAPFLDRCDAQSLLNAIPQHRRA